MNDINISNYLQSKSRDELPIPKEYHMKTRMLFFEYRFDNAPTRDRRPPPLFTLRNNDHEVGGVVYKSMYLMYIRCASEYEAAIEILGSWDHWKKLRQCKWFTPYLNVWKKEVELREIALVKKLLVDLVRDGDLSAAKVLLAENKQLSKKESSKRANKANNYDSSALDDIEELLKHSETFDD